MKETYNIEASFKHTNKKHWEVSESFLKLIKASQRLVLLFCGKQNCICETELLSTLSRLCVDFQTLPLLEVTKPTFSVSSAYKQLIIIQGGKSNCWAENNYLYKLHSSWNIISDHHVTNIIQDKNTT